MEDLLNRISTFSPVLAVLVGGLFAYERRVNKLEVKMDHIQETLNRLVLRLDRE
jgi:hypothetical protein